MAELSLDFTTLRDAYLAGAVTPTEVVSTVLKRIESRGDDGVWIRKLAADDILARARHLEGVGAAEKSRLPLYGLPFSVKDCIDVAGLPTTAACPAYAYIAKRTNLAVQRALDAGAILIGKTNMDQFATGVVGVRSPYGIARNPFDAAYIPGGSSSGAAVSVSSGLCSFAFGSDTGGSGRVPASYNNIVGLKPTLGLLSRADMVNASLSFDTVSVYALTAPDAQAVLDTCRAVDPADPYGREQIENANSPKTGTRRIAVPKMSDLDFFGNADAARLFKEGVNVLASTGNDVVEIDFAVFVETSRMMFEGPWIAERYTQVGAYIRANPDKVDPVVRQVITSSEKFSAADAFDAMYRLHRNVRVIRDVLTGFDLLAVPTVGTVYRIADVAADPIGTNARNGYYMNFVSMADLAAVAVPNGFLPNGMPIGMTFVGPAFGEAALTAFAHGFHRLRVPTLGATGCSHPGKAAAE